MLFNSLGSRRERRYQSLLNFMSWYNSFAFVIVNPFRRRVCSSLLIYCDLNGRQKLKEIQHVGPYTIMGYSIGATIAFKMAQQLNAIGDHVDNLVLLDGCPSYSAAPTDAKRLFVLLALQSMNLLRHYNEDQLRVTLNGYLWKTCKHFFNSILFCSNWPPA